jgi:hypothetical protein
MLFSSVGIFVFLLLGRNQNSGFPESETRKLSGKDFVLRRRALALGLVAKVLGLHKGGS